MKRAQKTKLLDKLHHGFVYACIGLTVFTALNIGLKGWEYYFYVRPERKAEQARIEKQLLMEGSGFVSSASEELAS